MHKQDLEKKINTFGPAELTQVWDGEQISEIEGPFTEEEYIKKHDELFPDLAEWQPDNKLMVIEYEKLNSDNVMLDDDDLI